MAEHAPMSLSAYAKSRNLNQGSISRAIKTGRLVRSVGRTETGAPCIIDADLADQEWARTARAEFTNHKVSVPTQVSPRGTQAPVTQDPDRARVGDGEPSEEDLARGNMLERWYSAELKRTKLAELEGTLVLAADVEREWADVLTTVRTKLLGLPTALRQACPHLSLADIDVVDRLVREALEDLAGPKETE